MSIDLDVIVIANAGWGILETDIQTSFTSDAERNVYDKVLERFKFQLDGKTKLMTTTDLVNYFKNGRKVVDLNVRNIRQNLCDYNYYTLNGVYLSDFLKKRGFKVELVNHFDFTDKESLIAKLHANPLAVAISTTFMFTPLLLKRIGDFVKMHNDKVKCIVGGPFLFNLRNEPWVPLNFLLGLLKDSVDAFIFENEGETALANVISALKDDRHLDGIKNIAYFHDAELVFNDREPESNILDNNIISWNELDGALLNGTVCVRTSNGCPLNCKFCTAAQPCGVQYVSLDRLRDELREIDSLGSIKNLGFIDEAFSVPVDRFQSICRMLIEEDFGFGWFNEVQATSINKDTIDLIKRSKCKIMSIGIESGDETVAHNMGRKGTCDDLRRAIGLIKDSDIPVHAHIIIGFPGETEESIQRTLEMLDGEGVDFYTHYIWFYYHRAPVHEDRHKYDLSGAGWNWKHTTMNSEQAAEFTRNFYFNAESTFVKGMEEVMVLSDAGYSFQRIKEMCNIRNELIKSGLRNDLSVQKKAQLLQEFGTLI